MTNQEKIEAVQQKCIEANPEIAIACDCPKGGIHINGARCYKCRGAEFVARTIRLADVLLALIQNYQTPDIGLGTGSAGQCLWWFEDRDKDGGRCFPMWNLREDDLTKQSPETIDFIHQLLTA